MRWIVCVLLLLTAATKVANGQDVDRWRLVTTVPPLVVSVDTTRIVPGERNGARTLGVWFRMKFDQPQKTASGESYATATSHWQVSCSPLADIADYTALYDADGKVVDSWDHREFPSPLAEPAPDTLEEVI